MGLRCTVFGHDWGEVDVQRDREEDGEEVVVTVREARTCDRCGAEDVLGESMEVTAIEPSGAEPTATERDHPATGERAGAPAAGDDGGADDDQLPDAEDDDGIILDEEEDGGSGERDPREWPGRPEHELEDDGDGEPSPWPDSAKESEDDEPPEERFVGADSTPSRDREDDAAPVDAADGAGGSATGASGEESEDAGGEPTHGVAEDVADDGGAGGTVDDALEPDDDGIIEAGRAPEDEQVPGGREADGADHVPAADGERGDAPPDEGSDVGDAAAGMPAESGSEPTEGGDDAEVLEETEPNEQSRLTAEEPVDPSDPGARGDDGVAGRGRTGRDGAGGSGRESAGGSTRDSGAGAGESTSSDGPSLDPSEPPTDAEPAPEDVEYYCPECGYVDDSKWPSRRAGDICPDCQRSYLAERQS
jgi:hypothetical protein